MIIKKKLALIAVATMGVAGSASAAVPTNISTALTDAAADAATVAGAALLVIIGVYAIKAMRKGL